MTALDLVAQAKQNGLTLALDGEKIRVRGRPDNPEAKAVLEEIRQRKAEVIEVLKYGIPSAEITDGEIMAVEICSNVLEAHIWLAFDESFDPKDGQAVFYVRELEFLKTKTPDQLKQIHAVKLTFGPGSRVRQ